MKRLLVKSASSLIISHACPNQSSASDHADNEAELIQFFLVNDYSHNQNLVKEQLLISTQAISETNSSSEEQDILWTLLILLQTSRYVESSY